MRGKKKKVISIKASERDKLAISIRHSCKDCARAWSVALYISSYPNSDAYSTVRLNPSQIMRSYLYLPAGSTVWSFFPRSLTHYSPAPKLLHGSCSLANPSLSVRSFLSMVSTRRYPADIRIFHLSAKSLACRFRVMLGSLTTRPSSSLVILT